MSDEYEYFNSEEELRAYEAAQKGTPHGRKVIESLFPGVRVTSDYRPPSHPLSQKNPDSYHKKTDRAVDIAAIPGMTFEDVAKKIKDAGYDILEMQDEYKNPSKNATGKHWHFVIGDQYEYFNSEEELKAAQAKQAVNAPEKPVQQQPEYQPLQTAGTEKTITTGAETAQQQDIEATLRQAAKDKIPFTDVADAIEQNYPGQIAREGKNLKWYYDHYSQGGKSPINWTADKNRVGENNDPNTITVEGDLADVAPYQEELTYLKDRALLAASQGSPAAAYRGIRRALGDTGEEVNQDKKEYEAEIQAQIDTSNAFGNPVIREVGGFIPEMLAGAGPEDLIPILGGATKAGRIAGAVGTNMAADAGLQGIEIAQGSQDAFSPERNLIAGALGGGLQAGGELLVSLSKKYDGKGVGVTEKSGNVVEVSDSTTPTAVSNRPEIKGRTVKGSPKDLKVQSISDEVAKITEGWTNSPGVVVYTNFGALQKAEPAIARGLSSDGAAKVPGFYNEDGRVHIIADNVKEGKLPSLLFHEALAHDGLAKEFGDKLADQMSMMFDKNYALRRETVNLAMGKYGPIYASTPQSKKALKDAMEITNKGQQRAAVLEVLKNDPTMKAGLAEEVLAKMSEGGPVTKSMMDKVAILIRDYARKIGMKNLSLSNREVRSILADAHARVMTGEGKATPSGIKYILTTHVSPHDFTNVDEENPFGKFDSSKMGTGEGAQVYSWGHYTGEQTRDVYMSKFSRTAGDSLNPPWKLDPEDIRRKAPKFLEEGRVNSLIRDFEFNPYRDDWDNYLDYFNRRIATKNEIIAEGRSPEIVSKSKKDLLELEEERDFIKGLINALPERPNKPRTYEVDAPDEITSRMLLWDETLDKQPEGVKKVVKEDLPGNHVTKEEMSDLRDQLAEADDAAREYYEKYIQPIYDEAEVRGKKLFEEEMDKLTSSEEALEKAVKTFTNKYPGRKEQAGRLARGLTGAFDGGVDNFVKDLEDLAYRIVDRKIGAWINENTRTAKEEYRELAKAYDDIKEKIDNARYLTGEGIYKEFVKLKGSPKAASLYLASKGIPGNKYKDGFTRHRSGEASYNYVWWNDEGPDAPKIINKYQLEESGVSEKVINKFMKAMKGARRLNEDYTKRVSEDRQEKLKKMAAARASSKGEKGFYKELESLRGTTTKSYIEPLRDKFSQREVNTLFNTIKNHPNLSWFEGLRARGALAGLLDGELPTRSELDLLDKVFPKEFVKLALDLRTTNKKFTETFMDIATIPRAMISSLDLSGAFRQGFFSMGRKQFWKNLWPMVKQFGSKEYHEMLMDDIKNHPYYEASQKAKLFIAEIGSDIATREEDFQSRTAEKIPGVGASNRAYSGFLNKVRFDAFVDMVDTYKSFNDPNLRVDLTEDIETAKQVARWLNNATGRGTGGAKFEAAAPYLTLGIWSPRLAKSRLNIIWNFPANPGSWHMWYNLHPVARREMAKDYAKMVAIMTTSLGLIDFMFDDVEVEKDPRSSDFLKVRIGEKRYDVAGGLGQWITFGARMIPSLWGEGYTKTATGQVRKLSGANNNDAGDTFVRFIRSKLAPFAGYVVNAIYRKNVIGEEFNAGWDAFKLMIPLFVQDMYKGYQEEGLTGAASALPSFIGFGYSKYDAVPAKYDAFGRTHAESKKADPVVEEILKLAEDAELNVPLVEPATKSNLPKEFKEVKDPEILEVFQQISGKYIMEGLRELVKTEEWRTMTNEDKVAAVRKVKKDARKTARDEVFGEAE